MVGRHQTAQEVNFLKEVFHKNWKQLKGGNTVDMMGANEASSSLTPTAFKAYYTTELASLNKQLDNQKQILNSVFLDAERNKLKHRRGIVAEPGGSVSGQASESTSKNRKRNGVHKRNESINRSINSAKARSKKLQEEEEQLSEQLKKVEIRRMNMRQARGSAWAPTAEAAIDGDDRIVTGFGPSLPIPTRRVQTSYGSSRAANILARKQQQQQQHGSARTHSMPDTNHKQQNKHVGGESNGNHKTRQRGGRGIGNVVVLRSEQRDIARRANTVLERGFRLSADRPRTSHSSVHINHNSSRRSRTGFTGRGREVLGGETKEEENVFANYAEGKSETRSSRQTQRLQSGRCDTGSTARGEEGRARAKGGGGDFGSIGGGQGERREQQQKSQQRPSTAGSCCTKCCGKETHRRTRLENRFHHFLEQQFITMNQATLEPDKCSKLVAKVNPGLNEHNRKVGFKPLVVDGPHPSRDTEGMLTNQ